MARTSRTGTRTDLALLGVALAAAVAALILPAAARGKVQGSLRSSVAAPLVAAQAWAERGRMAIGDHGRLVTKIDSLALGSQSAAPLRSENDRLRALLGLGQRLQWGFVATEVVHPPRGADEHTVLLAAGSAAGVRPFSPLVVPEGLIGMVTLVDASSSTAILWTHPDFRVSATTPDGVAFGIVAAHLGSGADRFLLEMRGVPFRSELKPGTLIVSSGLGNVFPRGIPIGVVLRETKTVEGWARTYLIRPMVSPDASTAAMVLLPPRAAAGVTGAWSSAAAAENTQKGIAVAGDSILADSVRRVQAQLEKLALLDSLRRAAIYRGDSGIRVEGDSVQGAGRMPAPVTPPATPAAATVPPPAVVVPASKPSVAPATTPSTTAPAVTTPAPRVTPPPTTSAPTTPAPKPTTVAPKPSTTAAPTGAATTRPVAPATRPAATPVKPPATTATATPSATATKPPVSAAPRDTAARAQARPRVTPGASGPRVFADSAGARNRRPVKKVRADTTRPPENPFRLPPAGGRE